MASMRFGVEALLVPSFRLGFSGTFRTPPGPPGGVPGSPDFQVRSPPGGPSMWINEFLQYAGLNTDLKPKNTSFRTCFLFCFLICFLITKKALAGKEGGSGWGPLDSQSNSHEKYED